MTELQLGNHAHQAEKLWDDAVWEGRQSCIRDVTVDPARSACADLTGRWFSRE